MRTALFWAVTQRVVVIAGVSGKLTGSIFKGPIGRPGTAVRDCHYSRGSYSQERSSLLIGHEDCVFVRASDQRKIKKKIS
jgi:hypothetical protein